MLLVIMNINNEVDREFVEDMYYNYEKRLRKLIRQILDDEDEVEECINNTFIRVIDNLDKFKERKGVAQIKLLVLCAKHVAYGMYNKNRVYKEHNVSTFVSDDDNDPDSTRMMDLPDFYYNPEEVAMSEENIELIIRIIEGLPDKYKDVMILKYKYDYDTATIAKILGITESGVRTRLERARKKIIEIGGAELYER